MESERCPDTTDDMTIIIGYGNNMESSFEWYLKNTDKPMQQNPYIPEGGYVPLDLAKDDPTKSDPFSLTGVTPGEIASSSNEKKKKKKKILWFKPL